MSRSKTWFMALVAAFVALLFPIAAERIPVAVIFGFFGVMTVFHLIWVIFVVRETKGRPFEEIA